LPGTDANGAATTTSLEGLSGDVWGLTGFYEKNGFQARIAQRYRSEFNATRHNAFKHVTDSIRPERITDLQVGYEIQSGQYKGLGILLQINNLSNTPYVVTQTVDGITALKEYHEFGRQLMLGLNYKL
jgi:iron complex outermembrane receptor protein